MSEQIARQFHDVYERLAPQFGYETREDTKVFDPQSQNGRLMIAVCAEVIGEIKRERDEAREDADSWKVEYEIVAARLRGEKHHRDNGIVSEDEIIPKLIRERDEAHASLAELRPLPASAGDASPSRVARGDYAEGYAGRELTHLAGVVRALRERNRHLFELLRLVDAETRRPSERFDEVWAEVREVLRG